MEDKLVRNAEKTHNLTMVLMYLNRQYLPVTEVLIQGLIKIALSLDI